uniref:U3-scytotoxin-Sth1h n=2 Tax=Scytodes thoracica TaxID=1112478 RepID=U31H_SCYTH|nr:RecName: Full=U3-scytotoxin-Sth1h; Short=U3-SYTX-Sth1h; Short=U3-Sth1h; Flags: Precursor [Scytodes thoracica]AIW62383.1 venom peptide U3-SYTX-Sth1h [Scytodes thoracica]
MSQNSITSYKMGFAKHFFLFAVLLCATAMYSVAEPAQERLIESIACMQKGLPCMEHVDCCHGVCDSLFCLY